MRQSMMKRNFRDACMFQRQMSIFLISKLDYNLLRINVYCHLMDTKYNNYMHSTDRQFTFITARTNLVFAQHSLSKIPG